MVRIVSRVRLASDNHNAGGEDLLIIRFGGHVAKSDAGHARHGEVERCDVHSLAGRTVDELGHVALIGPNISVRALRYVGQFPQPTVLDAVVGVGASDRVPDAGQPVRDQHVKAEQQNQHGRSVFQVTVQLAYDATQTQQPHHFECAEQASDSLSHKRCSVINT